MTILTCERQFEKRGDPWMTEREKRELQAQLCPVRGGRRYAKERPIHQDKPRDVRMLTELERERAKVRDNLLAIRQLVGDKPRTLTPLGPKAVGLLGRVYHPCKEELNPFDRDFDADERRWKEFVAAEKARIANK